MTTPFLFDELKKAQHVSQWRRYLEKDEEWDPLIESVLICLTLYTVEIGFRLGQSDPYVGELHRLNCCKLICRSLEPVLNELRDAVSHQDVPDAATAFWLFLRGIVLDLGRVISFIEARWPERRVEFDADRATFAASLAIQ